MVETGYYKNEGLSLAWDCMRVYENRIKVSKLYKSVQDY